jgi:hypothetical protein
LPASTNWPSQKIAPSGFSHWASQPPSSVASHSAKPSAWQSIWQSMLALPWHEPEQLASHEALQSADGGVPLHCTSHEPEQVALHDASQRALSLSAAQLPEQSALQSA